MNIWDDLANRHKKSDNMKKKITQSKSTSRDAKILADLEKVLKNMSYSQSHSSSHSFGSYMGSSGYPRTMVFPPSAQTVADKPQTFVQKGQPVEFDSVVLDPKKKQSVIEALEQIKNHDLIFEKWGFAKTLEKGKAVSMLFYGPPGTGKTLLAQAIADKLKKRLKVIGSAEIESSEPGAAERNIKSFFENTKADTILLFDECDSLVYDRQNVGSILAAQVNQLLSSLEKFEGIVIFTTNRLGVLDEAFNRRLSLKLEFELPTFEERVKIWKRMFPKEAPIGDINWEELASVEIAGGHIKNTVLRAARTAASQKAKTKLITQVILVDSLQAEVREMVKFMDAKENVHTPHQTGYTLSKGMS